MFCGKSLNSEVKLPHMWQSNHKRCENETENNNVHKFGKG